MSAVKLPPSGKYTFEGLTEALQKRIVRAEFVSSLDEVSQLAIVVALDGESTKKLVPRDFPSEVTFRWQERGLFKGNLVGVRVKGQSQLELIYQDGLSRAKKTHVNQNVSELTLRQCLEKLCAGVGLSPDFKGSFSDTLPAMNLSGASFFEHLAALATHYGFYFVNRSFAGQMLFVRVGSFVKEIALDAKTAALGNIQHTQASQGIYGSATFRHFDPGALGGKDKTVAQDTLYSDLGAFKEHGGFRERSRWTSAQGTYETHVSQSHHFDSGEALVRGQMAKHVMGQEGLTLVAFEPLGLPGDKLAVKGLPTSAVEDGSYLIQSTTISIQTAIPRMELTAIRA
jgi:hypothetical protein